MVQCVVNENSKKRPIYMDYMATTPVDPIVRDAMIQCLEWSGPWGNSSSSHSYGVEARHIIEESRSSIAKVIGALSEEVIFTSGATESINWALKGAMRFYQRRGKHLITLATEHKAVLETCRFLEGEGYQVSVLKPLASGQIDLDALEAAITRETVLISFSHVNNETGVIQDVQRVVDMAKKSGVLVHLDAAQSIGKVPLSTQDMLVDFVSLSAHKAYGPKGIGALYIRSKPRVRLEPLIHGGGQEFKLRGGTLAPHQIVGMSVAYQLAFEKMSEEIQRVTQLRDQLTEGLLAIGGCELNTVLQISVPHCINFRFVGVDGESLLTWLLPDLALSSGSACNAVNPEPSHVLCAMGKTRKEANDSLRLSLGRFTTGDDIHWAIEKIARGVKQLRRLSPSWNKKAHE